MTRFWESKALEELSREEWESLCDGCGRCCLHKLQDEDTDEVFYTNVACRLLDTATCRCTQYTERTTLVPECLVLSTDEPDQFSWLPATCAYRLLWEGGGLPTWHPLWHGGDTAAMEQADIPVRGRVIGEQDTDTDAEALKYRIIEWVD